MKPESAPTECFTDYALQEYAAGRLDAEIRAQVAGHIKTCAECRQALADLRAETQLLQTALAPRTPPEPSEPVSDESLALYLAGALEESQASNLETIISREPALLRRLLSLRREVVNTRVEVTEGVPIRTSNPERRGEILKMPRRTRPVATIQDTRQAEGG